MFPADDHVPKRAELGCAAGEGEDVGQHEVAANGDGFDVVDVRSLTLSHVAPAEGDVLGALAEEVLFAECDSGVAVL